MYALDTNTVIYFFKGQGNVAARLLATAPTRIGIPTLVIHEIETGIAKSANATKRQEQLDTPVDAIQVLEFDQTAARQSALVRAELETTGTPIGPFDTLIAGTALANSATLVTHNNPEFGRVPRLGVADWVQ